MEGQQTEGEQIFGQADGRVEDGIYNKTDVPNEAIKETAEKIISQEAAAELGGEQKVKWEGSPRRGIWNE